MALTTCREASRPHQLRPSQADRITPERFAAVKVALQFLPGVERRKRPTDRRARGERPV